MSSVKLLDHIGQEGKQRGADLLICPPSLYLSYIKYN